MDVLRYKTSMMQSIIDVISFNRKSATKGSILVYTVDRNFPIVCMYTCMNECTSWKQCVCVYREAFAYKNFHGIYIQLKLLHVTETCAYPLWCETWRRQGRDWLLLVLDIIVKLPYKHPEMIKPCEQFLNLPTVCHYITPFKALSLTLSDSPILL